MRKHMSLITLLALLLGLSATLWAQMNIAVRGAVKGQDGKPLAGAIVELFDSETGKKYDLKTNANGEYSSIGVAMGTYDYTLLKDGKPLDKLNKVPVRFGPEGEEMKPVNFDLSTRQPVMSEEQKKQREATQQQNEKIKTLNASLTQAKQMEAAGNWDEAVTVLQQASQVDPNQDIISTEAELF